MSNKNPLWWEEVQKISPIAQNPVAMQNINQKALETLQGGSKESQTPTVTPSATTPTPTFEYDKQSNLDDALKTAMSDWGGYNINADPFYQQMVDRYTKNAKMGMEDAMGRAAALTGGYGNSYAQSAGQQAYYNQMDKLNDLALDIYNNAYLKWRDKKEDAWDNYKYYATDKAAKEKQWMIDNGLWKGDDPKFDINKEYEKIGAKMATFTDGNQLTKWLTDMGYTQDQIDSLVALYLLERDMLVS